MGAGHAAQADAGPERRRPRPEGAERARRLGGDRGRDGRRALGDRRRRGPRERPVLAGGGEEEPDAEVLHRRGVGQGRELDEPHERPGAAAAGRPDRGREGGREPGAQVGRDGERDDVEPAQPADRSAAAAGDPHAHANRPALERLGERRHVAHVARRRRPAAAAGAEGAELLRDRPQGIGEERVDAFGRHDRVDQHPLHAAGVRDGVGEHQLAAVGDAEQRELLDAEGLAHGLEVGHVVAGRVEHPPVAHAAGAAGRQRVLVGARCGRSLQPRAVEDARVAGAAVVEGGEPIAGEELLAEVLARPRRVERERPGRALARPAGDHHHRAAVVGALGRQGVQPQ